MASGLGYSSTARSSYQQPDILSGDHFSLTFDYQKVNFTGEDRIATAINGSVPAPVLRWKQGERVTLDVTNNMAVDSSIHWHGMILPSAMDGSITKKPSMTAFACSSRTFDIMQTGTL